MDLRKHLFRLVEKKQYVGEVSAAKQFRMSFEERDDEEDAANPDAEEKLELLSLG